MREKVSARLKRGRAEARPYTCQASTRRKRPARLVREQEARQMC
jgi:hypothetical protein